MNLWYFLLFGFAVLALSAQLLLGYVVTPILFTKLDSQTAGDIAGILFALFSYAVMACALFSGLLIRVKQWVLPIWPMVLVFVLTLFSHFGLGGWMQNIKQAYPNGLDSGSADWQLFMQIHGVYQLLYLIVAVIFIGWIITLLKNDKKCL